MQREQKTISFVQQPFFVRMSQNNSGRINPILYYMRNLQRLSNQFSPIISTGLPHNQESDQQENQTPALDNIHQTIQNYYLQEEQENSQQVEILKRQKNQKDSCQLSKVHQISDKPSDRANDKIFSLSSINQNKKQQQVRKKSDIRDNCERKHMGKNRQGLQKELSKNKDDQNKNKSTRDSDDQKDYISSENKVKQFNSSQIKQQVQKSEKAQSSSSIELSSYKKNSIDINVQLINQKEEKQQIDKQQGSLLQLSLDNKSQQSQFNPDNSCIDISSNPAAEKQNNNWVLNILQKQSNEENSIFEIEYFEISLQSVHIDFNNQLQKYKNQYQIYQFQGQKIEFYEDNQPIKQLKLKSKNIMSRTNKINYKLCGKQRQYSKEQNSKFIHFQDHQQKYYSQSKVKNRTSINIFRSVRKSNIQIIQNHTDYQNIVYIDPQQQRKSKIDKEIIQWLQNFKIDWSILKPILEKQLHQFFRGYKNIWQLKQCLLNIQSQRRTVNSLVILFMEVNGVPMMLLNLLDRKEVYREKLYRLADGEVQLIFKKKFDTNASCIEETEMVQTIGKEQFRSLFDEERKKIKFSERSYIGRKLRRYCGKLNKQFNLSADIVSAYMYKPSF